MAIPLWILALGSVVVVIGTVWGIRMGSSSNHLQSFSVPLSLNSHKPRIWWHVDDSQTNTREWLDWGNRETVEPNEPYLRLCLKRARQLWSDDFEIVPLIGRDAVVDRLRHIGGTRAVKIPAGWDEVPPYLWMAWARAALLAAEGGLWLDGSVLPWSDSISLWQRTEGLATAASTATATTAAVFGYDSAESRASSAAAAGSSAGWAATSGHPVWMGLAHDIGSLIGAGAPSWSSPEARRALRTLWDRHCSGGSVAVDRTAEISRDKYGRRLELDTLLGATEWSAGSTGDGLWIPLPDGRDSLERTIPFQWFLRMDEQQIRESDFVWARWATRV